MSKQPTCITCRTFPATNKTPYCPVCNSLREKMRERMTREIQRYEEAFCLSFQRADEVWVRVSDVEEVCIGYADIPAPRPIEDEVIELKEGDYEIVNDYEVDVAV